MCPSEPDLLESLPLGMCLSGGVGGDGGSRARIRKTFAESLPGKLQNGSVQPHGPGGSREEKTMNRPIMACVPLAALLLGWALRAGGCARLADLHGYDGLP